MNVKTRQEIEKRIAREILRAAVIDFGCSVDLYDDMSGRNGGELVIENSTDVNTVLGEMFSTDSDLIVINKDGKEKGWIQLVYGNDGYDVIHDYVTRLEDLLTSALALSDKLAEQYS